MQIPAIASKIIDMEKVPVYFNNTKTFSSVTYLKPGTDNQRGLHLPNCDSLEALEYCKSSIPDGFGRIKELICTKCDFDEISFSVFSILHELGHWLQYIGFIDEGHNDMEFIINYEFERACLLLQRDSEYKTCKSKDDIVVLNKKYDKLYAELPTEKYANDFAINHLLEYVMMIKCGQVPYQLEQMRQVGKEYMDDLTERDQRMMHGVVTLTHLADSLEQLDQDTKSLQTRTGNCEFAVLNYQQEDALNTVLPYGLRRIDAVRTLTSESTAVLMPFKSQEIQDTGGIYYGVNPISHNLIICNRGSLMNGNGFIFGVSGSGKSMAAKQEITTLALATDHDIIIIDPEREYGPLVQALGGEIITISASSDTYINAMDISSEYGGGQNPLALKSDFIMSLCEQIMGAEQISARDKSIIDRCTANVYREYIKTYKGDPPTLKDLHDDLMRQKEPAAHDIALALELFTTGTLDVFAHQTNVNSRNRILCFDIQDLGENLKPIGLLVMLDAIMNRVIANRAEGKYTHVYIDEIYLFFAGSSMGGAGNNVSKYSAEFLYKCWKRFRKYYATLTGITQNVEECLRSDTARMMFANSEFLLMFNQAPNDREVLAHILNASSAQMSYVSDKPPGHGLIKVGGAIVPLVNEFPKDTSLYWLMTTKPGEG